MDFFWSAFRYSNIFIGENRKTLGEDLELQQLFVSPEVYRHFCCHPVAHLLLFPPC